MKLLLILLVALMGGRLAEGAESRTQVEVQVFPWFVSTTSALTAEQLSERAEVKIVLRLSIAQYAIDALSGIASGPAIPGKHLPNPKMRIIVRAGDKIVRDVLIDQLNGLAREGERTYELNPSLRKLVAALDLTVPVVPPETLMKDK